MIPGVGGVGTKGPGPFDAGKGAPAPRDSTPARLPAQIAFTRLRAVSAERLLGGTHEVVLEGALGRALPGQFLMADVDPDAPVMRPYTVFRTLDDKTRTLLVRSPLPERLEPGREVAVIGPLGTPFPAPGSAAGPLGSRLAIVDAGRLAPVYEALREALYAGYGTVRLIAGGTREAHFDGLDLIRELGIPVEVVTHVVPSASSRGALASLIAGLDSVGQVEELFLALPEERLKELTRALDERRERGLPVPAHTFAALETPMACGVGACYGCPVPLKHPADPRHPYARACKEGPVMPLGEVALA